MARDREGAFFPRVNVEMARARSKKALAKLGKTGAELRPVELTGNKIATTFWGKAWCANLERYSDFETRLPRGRSYLRTGAVIDLSIEPQNVRALVQGTELYEVKIEMAALAPASWKKIVLECAGSIDSMIDLLQGALSNRVIQVATRPGAGLFPAPRELKMDCSCPDWAVMCKHVAAVLYGVGVRLDTAPELFFVLRGVDAKELVTDAASSFAAELPAGTQTLSDTELQDIFGATIDFDAEVIEEPEPKPGRKTQR
jgi:uncharacterized Zn finger protein